MLTGSALLLGVLAQVTTLMGEGRERTSKDQAPVTQSPIDPNAPTATSRPPPPIEAPAWRTRRFGVHLGLNGTFTFDASIGRFLYVGATTQLTGLAAPFVPDRNFNLSLLAFGGVALPLVERESLRLTADIAPSFAYTRAAPVNLLSVGLLAGVRLVHRSGFTFAVKLPLVGYAGAPDAQRGGLMFYYINAIVVVPAITFGYSF